MNNQKGFANIILIIIIIILAGATAYFALIRKPLTSTTLVTGLPKEIENNQGFRSSISDKGGLVDKSLLPFGVSSSRNLELESIRIDTDQNRHLYFDNSGNPIFLPAEPEYRIRIEGYSPDRRYALEIVTSEPDTLAYLWDLKEKKFFQVGACGTVCGFSDFDWLDDERVIVWGNEANPAENYDWSKGSAIFVTLFNLKNLSATSYLSKIIPPKQSVNSDMLKITSVSPSTVTVGSTITINGSGFSYPNPVRRTGMSYILTDATVVMQNANGQKISVFSLEQGKSHNDNIITFTLPSRVCKYAERGCGASDPDSFYFDITPGTYSLFVLIPNTSLVSNSVDITVK